MAFVNQFQPLQATSQRLKLLQVICQEAGLNETGFADFVDIGGPTGLTADDGVILLNGVPVDPTTIRVTATSLTPVQQFISGGKVFNVVNAAIIVFVNGTQINTVPGIVPIFGALECKCDIIPTDVVQKHDVEFVGGTLAAITAPDGTDVLRLTATIRLCLVVARETLVRVQGTDLFCN